MGKGHFGVRCLAVIGESGKIKTEKKVTKQGGIQFGMEGRARRPRFLHDDSQGRHVEGLAEAATIMRFSRVPQFGPASIWVWILRPHRRIKR